MTQDFPISRQLEQRGLQVAPLAQRANAAAVDMALVGVICFGLEWAMRVTEPHRVKFAIVCAATLAGVAGAELFFGWTVGKSLSGLALRTSASKRPPVYRAMLRGFVRLLPVIVFLSSLFVRSDMLALLLWGISLTAVCCYICTAYLTLVRSGVTPFDMAANSVVVKVRPPRD